LGKEKRKKRSNRRRPTTSSGGPGKPTSHRRKGVSANRKNGGSSPSQPPGPPCGPNSPDPTGADGFDGQPWFRETCGNTLTHTIIAEIEALLAQGTVSPEQSKSLLDEVIDYKGAVTRARCPLLCALFITVVKKLAFIAAPEDLYGKLFGTAVEAWKTGLDFDRASPQVHGPVFNIQTFLHGWSEDLKRVRKEAFSAYAGFLRFHDVHSDGVQFDQAVGAFVQRVQGVLTTADVALAGRIALNFGQDILAPLLDHNRAMALKHTKAAAALIDAAVCLDPVAALGNESKPALMALRWLEDHIRQSGIPPLVKDRTSPETGAGLRDGAYKILNELWRKLEPQYRSHMEQPYSTLLPMLGGWERRASRLAAPPDWWVWISFSHAGKPREVGGAVIDLCPSGRGFHVSLPGQVEHCEDRKNGGVDLTFKGGAAVPVENVNAVFRFPDGSSLECRAQALRGWRYEVTKEVYKDFCGAVFVIDRPEDAAVLKIRLSDMTAQVGMAAPPDKPPVPPVEASLARSTAGATALTGREPSPELGATGDDEQPSVDAGTAVNATTGRATIDAPAAECYGEIDMLGEGDVVLRIFLANPGPGRKPELCEPIRLTKQACEILLAGIEDARQRYIDDKQEEPPDAMTFIIEWTRNELVAILHARQKNSFEELDAGERKALKTAIGRLRGLVTFGKGQERKFVTPASKDFVRKTTIPVRLRRAGRPEVE